MGDLALSESSEPSKGLRSPTFNVVVRGYVVGRLFADFCAFKLYPMFDNWRYLTKAQWSSHRAKVHRRATALRRHC